MKKLFDHLKKLVETAQAPLFTSFTDDFYKLDKDVIMNDMQIGDCWYFSIKQCGTYLTLAHNKNEYLKELMSPRHSPERRHFLIHVLSDETFECREHTFETLAAAVSKINPREGRKEKRRFANELLFTLEPMLRNSIIFNDFSIAKDAVIYLSLNNNSVSYVTKDGKSRVLGMPFSFERKIGYFKITVTTEFGHAVCEQVKAGVYTRAQKKYLAKKAA